MGFLHNVSNLADLILFVSIDTEAIRPTKSFTTFPYYRRIIAPIFLVESRFEHQEHSPPNTLHHSF